MMNKPILIILPGWGGSHETWQEFIKLAEEKYQVECIDLPCFGGAPCPETIWGVEEYANFVKNKIKQLFNQPIIILGHSFGGQVAAYFTAKNQDMVEKLVLVGAATLRPNDWIRRGFFGAIARVGKWVFKLPLIEHFGVLAKKILYRAANSPDFSETAGIKRDIFKKIVRQDLAYLLTQIKVPTVVIWGVHDTYVPLKLGRKIAQLIPNAKLIVLPGKHGLHLTSPVELLKNIAI